MQLGIVVKMRMWNKNGIGMSIETLGYVLLFLLLTGLLIWGIAELTIRDFSLIDYIGDVIRFRR